MRIKTLVSVGALTVAMAAVALATTGDHGRIRQSAVVHFARPTWVATTMLQGTYVVVHDKGRMMRGEPCTTLYAAEARRGQSPESVEFRGIPRKGPVAPHVTTTVERNPARGIDTLIEYQFAGDAEIHGVPNIDFVSNMIGNDQRTMCVR